MSNKENKRKCSKCGASPAEDGVTLFRVLKPGVRNLVRCEKWAKYLFPERNVSSIAFLKTLYNEHRMLCNRHFKDEEFTDNSRKQLLRTAVPCDVAAAVGKKCVTTKRPSTEDSFPEVLAKRQKKEQAVSENQPGTSCKEPKILGDTTNLAPAAAQALKEHDYVQNLIHDEVSAVSNKRPPPEDSLHEQSAKRQKKEKTLSENQPGPSCKKPEVLGDATNNAPAAAEALKEHDYVQHLIDDEVSAISNKRPPPKDSLPETFAKRQKKDTKSVKEKKYYLKCRQYLKRVCQLRNSIKKYKARDQLNILCSDDTVKKLHKKISPSLAVLLQGEIKNLSKRPKGRRWSTEEKILSLRIYKRSPTCYRLLRRMFCLPAPSSLKKLLSAFSMPPGINKKIMAPLNKHVKRQKASDNQYILMFDEISIKKHLQYNKKEDCIDGFQDHGEHGRTSQEAVKALVFMVAGIRKRVKQPLSYYLSGANVTADRLSVIIKETIRECFNAGIQVSATVCDMGGTNRRALTMLGATEQRPIINVDDKEIVTLFDAPHLLKCFRNMFMKYDIQCKTSISSSGIGGEGLAKWSDIEKFHEIDSTNANFVFAPSLKKEHLMPNTKQKMKVNLAAQVLSHTVAAGIMAKVAAGEMPASAIVTADVIDNIDKLFDLMNSDTSDCRRGKPYATNMSKKSPHGQHFNKMKLFFKNLTFVGCPRPPPSLEGWVWTINGLEYLWNKFQKYEDVYSLATRRLQQDPLENLFGCIRGNCGSNANPTTSAFVGGMKTAVMSNLSHISIGNCEEDDNVSIINNLKTLLSVCELSTNICTDSPSLLPAFESTIDVAASDDTGEIQACAYVCGFLIKNHKHLKCDMCSKILLADEQSDVHTFVACKEYNDLKKSLKYASNQFIKCVENCATATNALIAKYASKNNLKKIILHNVNNEYFAFLSKCEKHENENKLYISNSVFHICVKRYCILKNRECTLAASASALAKKINILKNI